MDVNSTETDVRRRFAVAKLCREKTGKRLDENMFGGEASTQVLYSSATSGTEILIFRL